MATKTKDESVKKKKAIEETTPKKEELKEDVEAAASDVVAEEVQKEEAKEKKAPKKKATPKKTAKKATKAKKADKAEETKEKAEEKPAKSETEPKAKTGKKPQTMEELFEMTDYKIVVPKKGEVVSGVITNKGKKMLTVDIGAKTEGIVADKEFEAASEYIDELEVGKEIDAVVASAESSNGQVLLSLKKAASDAKWDYFDEAFKEEKVLEAKGIDVNKGGLIVVVNGTRGFVPSSQFGKALMGNYMQLKGKSLRVRAIEVDREKNRLIFSERHVSEEDEIANKEQALESVKEGEIYEGVVSGVMHFGLFVTVEVPVEDGDESIGHVEGLVHISEISWEKVSHPKDYHQVGDRLKVKVLGVDEKTGKLNLSIKQLSDDPWTGIDEKYEPGSTITGTVSRVESFGVFVNVEEGVDGLIHSSKLEPGSTLEKGEEVTVHVESVDPAQRRMSLSVVLTEVPVGYK